uniref:Uncharacterized protein n=1 Tax=Ascaris lumbricoides TaxID=6252 RepID=A0A0M3IX38_ASCLU
MRPPLQVHPLVYGNQSPLASTSTLLWTTSPCRL